jgi:polyhydroxybutyrate depolymerase
MRSVSKVATRSANVCHLECLRFGVVVRPDMSPGRAHIQGCVMKRVVRSVEALLVAGTMTIALAAVGCTASTARGIGDVSDAATSDAAATDASSPDSLAPQPKALILILHGVGGAGGELYAAWGMANVASPSLLILDPTGSKNMRNQPSWNASKACCNDTMSPPDDATMLAQLVHDAVAANGIDPRFVFVAGDSNGAFMTWRLLCTHADLFAAGAIVSGGANSAGDPPCMPSRHVPILSVHGTADPVIQMDQPVYIWNTAPAPALPPIGPGGSWAQEAAFNGCTGTLRGIRFSAFDHDASSYRSQNNYGAETDVLTFDGCPADGPVEVWRMLGSPHDIPWGPTWAPDLIAWLTAHHR